MKLNGWIVAFQINVLGIICGILGLLGYPPDSFLPFWYHLIGIPLCTAGAIASWKSYTQPPNKTKFTAMNPWGENTNE